MSATIKNLLGTLSLIAIVSLPAPVFAEGKLQETELHYVRNDLERLNTSTGFAEIALQRSGNALVKAFAQQIINNHTALIASLNAAMVPYDSEIHPNKANSTAPAPQTGAPPPNGGMAAGGAAQAAQATGPAVFAKAIKSELSALSGDALDKMFLLRIIQYHEDVQRRTSVETRLTGANADILKWIGANLPKIEADTAIAQRIVLGQMTDVSQLAKGR